MIGLPFLIGEKTIFITDCHRISSIKCFWHSGCFFRITQSHGLNNLIVLVDVNNQQADGPSGETLAFEPLGEKWRAFGWETWRVDGNDISALLTAFDTARTSLGTAPRVIICDTLMGKGVPFLERREKTHFIRVDDDEWALALEQLRAGAN